MATNEIETSLLSVSNSVVCSICLKEASKYTCPRCNVRYCSVACYRGEKHLACSEAFYKNCVLDELKDLKASPEERKQILEMLARTEEDYGGADDDDEDEDDLGDRIAGLDLDTDSDEIFRRLSEKEKREFHAMVRDGRLANLVNIWTPWWTVKDSKLVSEVGEESPKSPVPPVLSSIPDIHGLIKNKKASSDVKYNVVNALFAYAFVSRLHNGEHLELAVESAEDMLSASDILGSTKSCTGVGEAIHMSLAAVSKFEKLKERGNSQEFTVSVIEDVVKIIQGPSKQDSLAYLMSALSDLEAVFRTAKSQLSKEMKDGQAVIRDANAKELKSKFFLAAKKCSFFLSWCQRFGMSLQGLIIELELEFCSLSSELAEVSETKSKFEESWGGAKPQVKPARLIEEIS
ncbi:zinc finger HIT domain-containing protein 2-like isoform X2 [Liolophura sinensis]|uniref:zinc finger HIT domain-containing protein 2-like isoform X2 n=1 Tax=Liolophura sinensis TaxID=3198878 RepID=UPI0031593CAC